MNIHFDGLFDETDVRKHVGHEYFFRGLAYYQAGRVHTIKSDKDEISGLVQGSDHRPYRVTLILKNGKIVESECSCPMDGYCKHAAAVGIAIIRDPMTATQRQQQSSLRPWEQALETFFIPDSSSSGSTTKDKQPARTILQLLFRIKENQKSYNAYGYQPRQTKSAWQLELKPQAVDPITGHTRSGQSISWHSALYRSSGDLDPLHALHFRQCALALMNGSLSSSDWMPVMDQCAVAVWHALTEAAHAGIKFKTGRKGILPVEISPKPIHLQLTMRDKGTNVEVIRTLSCGDKEINASNIFLVGDLPVFVVRSHEPIIHTAEWENKTIQFHQADQSLKNFSAQTPHHITIPASDLQTFQARYLGTLARAAPIDNQSSRVRMPIHGSPILKIRIGPSGKQGIAIANSFLYKNAPLSFSSLDDSIILPNDSIILRNKEHESRLIDQLKEAYMQFPHAWTHEERHEPPQLQERFTLHGLEAARFLKTALPPLRENTDITVDINEKTPTFTFDESDPHISFSVRKKEDSTDHDWFNLSILVMVGGEQVPFQELFTALSADQDYLLLPSGRYFSLQHNSFAQLHNMIREARTLRDISTQGIAISRFQIDFWQELKKLGVVESQAAEWKSLADTLLNSKGVERIPAPASLIATLRPYQHDGFSWLAFLHKHRLGGVLGDDMGLGKTIQTIALIAAVREQSDIDTVRKPFLVIAPTSVVENWDEELKRFAPSLERVILRSGNRSESYEKMSNADVIVTSYALVRQDFEYLKHINFDTIILDEAQMIKNHQSKGYMLIRQLSAERRFALTGTPMENNLLELWSIFSLVAPGLFNDPEHFREYYQRPIETGQNQDAVQRLKARIRPFFLRRTKDLVERDLPAKNEQIITIDLHPKHRRIYDLHLHRERQRILGMIETGGLKSNRFQILRSLTIMRQLALHPALVDAKYASIPASKLEILDNHIQTLIAGGHRALIFSQFTSFLAHVRTLLDRRKIPYLYLDGRSKKRGDLVREFQAEKFPVFLISLKAGGFGLNLTAADYCIVLDPWWNPAAERQAVDRAHRIGQTKPVHVYKFITKGTIEEKVLALQQKKKRLFDALIDNENNFASMITEEEIRALFDE